MLEMSQHGSVKVFKTGRSFGKHVLYSVYCYLVDQVLIDTSTGYVAHELTAALKNEPVDMIVNTHHHEDHTGNNHLLQTVLGIQAYAHPAALPIMAEPLAGRQRLYLRLLWNYPHPSQALPLGEQFSSITKQWEVIHTPGHTWDHVCLYDPRDGLLFSGDIYCGERVKYLRRDEDFHQILDSLRKLEALPIETLFCCVAGIVPHGKVMIRRKIEYMEDLKSKVMGLHRQGLSPTRIKKALLGKEGVMYWASGGHFSKQNLVNSILGRHPSLSDRPLVKE